MHTSVHRRAPPSANCANTIRVTASVRCRTGMNETKTEPRPGPEVTSVPLGIQIALTYLLLARRRRPAADSPEHGGATVSTASENCARSRKLIHFRSDTVQFSRAADTQAVRPRSPFLPPGGTDSAPFGDVRPALSGGQPEVLLIRCKARPHRVRPADPLKPARDLGVTQVMVIAALAADELKRVGAAFSPALHDAGRLAPQARRAAVVRLASSGDCREILVVTTRPRVTGMVRSARYGNGTRTIRRPNASDDVRVSRARRNPPLGQ
jgi:hypothetical protein